MFVGLIPSVNPAIAKSTSIGKTLLGISVGGLLSSAGLAIGGLLAFPTKTAKTDLESVNEFLGYDANAPIELEPEIPNPLVGGQEVGTEYEILVQYGHWNGGDSYFFTSYARPSGLIGEIRELYMIEYLSGQDPQTQGQRFDANGDWTQSNRRARFGGVRNYNFYVSDNRGDDIFLQRVLGEEMARFSQPMKKDGTPDTGGNLPPIQEATYQNNSSFLNTQPPKITADNPISDNLKTLENSSTTNQDAIAKTIPKNLPTQQQATDLIEPPTIPDIQQLPRILPDIPNYNNPVSPAPGFLPDRVLPRTQPVPNGLPSQGLTVSSAPSNPNQISLNKTPKREPLPIPFALPKSDFDCEKLTECIGEGLDFGDIADVINNVTESITLKSPSCQEDSSGNNEVVITDTNYNVPANLGDALVLLNSQLLKIFSSQCTNNPYVIATPDAWQMRRAVYPKQIVMKFRSEKINSRFYYKKITVPHIINEQPNYDIDIPAYTSGDYYLRIYFKDNSHFQLYVDSETTANNILTYLIPRVEPGQLYDPLRYTIAIKRGAGIAVHNWKPIEKSFYAAGDAMKYQNVVWSRRFQNNPN